MRKGIFPADLEFEYLPHLAFRSKKERRLIMTYGQKHLANGNVPSEALKLGETYKKNIECDYCPNIFVRYVNDRVGHGVFAKATLKAGKYIGEYAGVVREKVRIYFIPPNPYCYDYPIPDAKGENHVIDGTQGNFTRFINHSKQPNLGTAYAFLDGFYHLIFFTLKDTQKGEQLCCDYGDQYWYFRPPPENLNQPG